MMGSNNVISTKRKTTNNNKTDYATNLSGIDCFLAQTDPRKAANFVDSNAIFDVYTCVIDRIVDIQDQDRVIDKDGNEYAVKNIRKMENNDDVPDCMELLLMFKDA